MTLPTISITIPCHRLAVGLFVHRTCLLLLRQL
nr:MAG TPA: hypothetical protein [Caudoviricetes sp.]